ncbi:MAG TPA: sigma 54-interacting transcriptional regulator, partial [Puia sp.]
QAKLLRVLQEREITRIGANAVMPINVRIIVATHKNLLDEVKNKTFREDLYYRLVGLPIHLPPLRERGTDIAVLAKSFVDNFCKENKIARKVLTPEAQQKLTGYPFPGNVRELKSIMELAVVMSDGESILPEHITLNASTSISDLLNRETTLKEFESQIIQHYLDKYDKDVLLVARKLDIGKSTIYRMIQNGELKSK